MKQLFTLLFTLFFAQALQAQCSTIAGYTLLGEHGGHDKRNNCLSAQKRYPNTKKKRRKE